MDGYIASNEYLDSRQFHIAVRRLADSLGFGADRSAALGPGLEYVQSRLYAPGDPVKSIDWRVTARTRKHHVKEFEAPRRLPAYLLVDTSASMTIRSGKHSKYETAIFIAGGLALACLDRISPVGVLGVGDSRLHVRPSLSRETVLGWLHRLREYNVNEPTRLAARITQLAPQLGERTLIIVLSDLHEPESLLVLKSLAQKHDCIALQFRDPAERGIPGTGWLRAREAETGRTTVSRGGVTWSDPEAIAQELRRAAVHHLLIDVDQPYVPRLRHFFRSRGATGQGTR